MVGAEFFEPFVRSWGRNMIRAPLRGGADGDLERCPAQGRLQPLAANQRHSWKKLYFGPDLDISGVMLRPFFGFFAKSWLYCPNYWQIG